jgi:hypothetical protein
MSVMSRRALLGISAAAAGSLLSPCVRAQTWSDVIATDMRFRIEMPAPVARKTVDEQEASFAGPRMVYQASGNGNNFDFDYVDYRPEVIEHSDRKAMILDLGRGVVEKAFPRARYKYVRDEAVTLDGWEGYALDLEGENGDGVIMRTYLVTNRLYRLLVTYGTDPATKVAAVRFVDSFKIADAR